ncbi:MAG: 50S ribosomal protein L1 [Candidatus Shikimatogenerans bostrichidophilus]|nr:MAG: 50S ribosomal protein L1 [Candidatus Shikimatogenerans bostrichidophilus]
MIKLTKNLKKIIENYKKNKIYNLKESLEIIKKYSFTKFIPTINLTINLDIKNIKNFNLKKTIYLPHSNGKKYNLLVLIDKYYRKKILNMGIKLVGGMNYINKIEKYKWTKFDLIISNKYYMEKLLKLGRILGVKNLMPSYEEDTIIDNYSKKSLKMIKKIILGKRLLIKPDKYGILHLIVGKNNIINEKIIKNISFIIKYLKTIKFNGKNLYIDSIYINSTMSPSLKLKL